MTSSTDAPATPGTPSTAGRPGGGTPPAGVAAVLPGLLACLALAAGAMGLALPALLGRSHVSPLLIVILLGMLVRSVVPLPAALGPGIRMAQRPVLRWAVAGLGFRLVLAELVRIGAPALVVVVVSTFAALVFGWWLAARLGVGHKLGLLLGVGGAICGASAVIAADTVVQGERRDAALALAVITLLGTIGIAVYPVIGHATAMPDFLFGVWDGASLHEMAQVVAAGFGMSDEAARVATVVKLARITLLAPVVLALSWWMRHEREKAGEPHVAPVPWFLVLFVVFAAVNSSGLLPAPVIEMIKNADLWLLCVGMAGVGLQTGFGDLRSAGLRPVAAGAGQWLFLSGLSYGLARWWCR